MSAQQSTQQFGTKGEIKITGLVPVYELNYRPGYIGFLNKGTDLTSLGIAYFTGWDSMSEIHVTHTLIVTDEDECVEADMVNNCVKTSSLSKYFNDPNCQIFFRKPVFFNDAIGNAIVHKARLEVGKEYDFRAIFTQGLSGSFPGRVLDRLLTGKFEEMLGNVLDDPNKWICSELVAYTLDEQLLYRDKGILKSPNCTISPQELFQDTEIFKPWKKSEPLETETATETIN
ncbi:hypothetical protein [Microcoleus asticus]|uniref:Uncharacterized protein n=1 Tax=Microcoleus asticus IPMA8 TaxID=2563858 RepID=A0ABX2D742_9CYAN|nr:hypothetical protein [Microcoleus asticus]NQE38479.1 hypothetical protein [Microcoleus asticus IPMA8]